MGFKFLQLALLSTSGLRKKSTDQNFAGFVVYRTSVTH